MITRKVISSAKRQKDWTAYSNQDAVKPFGHSIDYTLKNVHTEKHIQVIKRYDPSLWDQVMNLSLYY